MKTHPDCAKYESLMATARSGQEIGMSDYEWGVFIGNHMKHCPTGYHTRKGLEQENFLQIGLETIDPQAILAIKQRLLQTLSDKLKKK